MSNYLQTKFLTHRQQVLRLYKAAVKNERNWFPDRHEWRYKATLIRDRFEQNRNVLDLVKAQQILAEGQQELANWQHPNPLQFPDSPGGVGYGREPRSPDWVLDQWHPMEKAQFPEYFKKRSEMKKEYIEWYVKKYGVSKFNPEEEGHVHELDGGHHHHDDHHHGSKHH